MTRKVFLTVLALGALSFPAHAQNSNSESSAPATSPAQAAETVHDITVKVHGLVCDFCARALEKVFGKRDEVKSIAVDMDNHNVEIDLKEGANIPDTEITTMIQDSGYNVVDIMRSDPDLLKEQP